MLMRLRLHYAVGTPHGRRHFPHPTLPCMQGTVGKWGLLLPGAPEPRLTLLRRQGFRSVFQTAYAA
jgi:hypothetical protein